MTDQAMVDDGTHDRSEYWHPNRLSRSGVDLLNLMRRYRAAENEMRRRTRTSMRMNETDMEATRFLLRAGQRGDTVNATELATHLGITSASTTALVKRLVAAGAVERRPDPSDGRGTLLVATYSVDDEVRTTLTDVHARMIAAAEQLSPTTVAEMGVFFQQMIAAMHADESPASTTRAGAPSAPITAS